MTRFVRLRMLRRDLRADASMWACISGLVAVTTFVATAGPPVSEKVYRPGRTAAL